MSIPVKCSLLTCSLSFIRSSGLVTTAAAAPAEEELYINLPLVTPDTPSSGYKVIHLKDYQNNVQRNGRVCVSISALLDTNPFNCAAGLGKIKGNNHGDVPLHKTKSKRRKKAQTRTEWPHNLCTRHGHPLL